MKIDYCGDIYELIRYVDGKLGFQSVNDDYYFDIESEDFLFDPDWIKRIISEPTPQDWEAEYWLEDGRLRRDLGGDFEDIPLEICKRYEIVFDICGVRRYCFVDAVSMNEALGIFFSYHNGVKSEDIVDHIEC